MAYKHASRACDVAIYRPLTSMASSEVAIPQCKVQRHYYYGLQEPTRGDVM